MRLKRRRHWSLSWLATFLGNTSTNMKFISIFILFLFIGTHGFSADSEDLCKETNGGGAMAAASCSEQEFKKSESELNKAYEEALIRVTEEEHGGRNLSELFEFSQEKWLKYRDSYCEFEGISTFASGGWDGVHISNCQIELNKKRTNYLNSVFFG